MRIWNLFKARDKPSKKRLGGSFGDSFLFGGSFAGKVVNERTALQVTAVYACIRVLSDAVAGLPLQVYKYSDSGKEKAVNHPLYRLLHNAPNSEMTSFVWREIMMTHLLLYGNSYTQIIRNGRGDVIELFPLFPQNMSVERNEKGNIIYNYRTSDKGDILLSRENVLHIPALGFDGIMGYSPIALAKQTIGSAIAVEEYGSKFFANGANPGGVLEHPAQIKDIQRIKDSWNAQYQGTGNAHKVAILEDGMTYKQIGIPPGDAQFLDTKKYSVNEICRLFKVPPHLVADLEKATFSNIEHQSIDFVVHSVNPWVTRLEQSFNNSLISQLEQCDIFIKFNIDGLLRGDYESRMRGYATARQNGWLSANDIRELENLNRISAEDGGDLYLVNGNMMPMTATLTRSYVPDNSQKNLQENINNKENNF